MNSQRPKRVFLSYSSGDREKAKKIYSKLVEAGVNVFLAETELSYEDSIIDSMKNKIGASDYIIMLISKDSYRSKWLTSELRYGIDSEFKARDVVLIPVLLDYQQAPLYLSEYQPVKMRPDFEHGIQKLIDRIKLIPRISLENLDARRFEELVVDLLKSLNFKTIERGPIVFNREFDVKAVYSYRDPFGYSITETWLVETKFYGDSRLDLNTLAQAVSYLSPAPGDYKILLVTNGYLTSASREWLENLKKKEKAQIRVIEGSRLKTLLMKHKNLAYKYFGNNLR